MSCELPRDPAAAVRARDEANPALPLGRRTSPDQLRDAALEAARALLVESGPQALTLKAVAGRIGRTHATLLHHFGSAEGLQTALIARMSATITASIREAVLRARAVGQESREVVDLAFDAFGAQGAGALASWMILSGNEDALDPILTAIHDLIDDLAEGDVAPGRQLAEETFQLVLLALGDALMGGPMTRALNLPRGQAREIAFQSLLNRRAAT